MEKITLELSRQDYPNVLKIYGAEGAKDQAIDMLMAQNMEITETNLYSALTNLEMDLEFQTAASMSDEEE